MAAGKAQEHDDSDHEEDRDEDEEQAERPRRPAGDGKRGQQRPAAQSFPAADGQLGSLRRESCQVGDAHEPEPASPQRRDELLESRDRLRTVAASVVQEDDSSSRSRRRCGADDLSFAGLAPVLSVEVRERDQVPLLREPRERFDLRRRERGRNGGVRRPDQPRADPDDSGNRVLGQRDLE